MLTSIVIPTLSRPTQLRRNVERLLETVKGLDTEIIIAAEVNRSSVEAVKDLHVRAIFQEEWRGSIAGWNRGASIAKGDVLVTGADDIWWHDGWLEMALGAMQTAGTCYVGLNDCIWNGNAGLVTHWAITRQGAIDLTGGCLQIPAYKTTWTDVEVKERMRRAGQFQWCARAIAEHQHYINGAAHVDGCYLTMRKHYDNDGGVFKARQAAGFPDDFEGVIANG
jgi:glycosyltransferase involved in cell wall biosynthesis